MSRELDRLASRQGGVWTWEQSLAAGYTPRQVRYLIRCGTWSRLLRGVFAYGHQPPTLLQMVRAARLLVPPWVVVGRNTAASLHGFGVVDDSLIHLLGPPGTDAARHHGLRVHAVQLRPEDVVLHEGIPVTTPVRTVVDLCRMLPPLDALPVVDAALRSGKADPLALADELERHAGLSRIVQARRLVSLGDGRAESPMESRMRLRILDAGLPAPQLQYPVRLPTADAHFRFDLAWKEAMVAAEFDGAGHRDQAQLRHDRRRHNVLREHGWLLLYFTDLDVYRHPDQMIARIETALRERGLRGPARPDPPSR